MVAEPIVAKRVVYSLTMTTSHWSVEYDGAGPGYRIIISKEPNSVFSFVGFNTREETRELIDLLQRFDAKLSAAGAP